MKHSLLLIFGFTVMYMSAQRVFIQDNFKWIPFLDNYQMSLNQNQLTRTIFSTSEDTSYYYPFSTKDISGMNYDVVLPEDALNYVVSFKLNLTQVEENQNIFQSALPLSLGGVVQLYQLDIIKQGKGYRLLLKSGNEREISKNLLPLYKDTWVVIKLTGIKGVKLKTELWTSTTGQIIQGFDNLDALVVTDLPKEKRYVGFGQQLISNIFQFNSAKNKGGIAEVLIAESESIVGVKNPNQGKVILKDCAIDSNQAYYGILTFKSTQEFKNATLKIIDLNSNIIQDVKGLNIKPEIINDIAVQSIPKGIYIAFIQDDNYQYQQKIMIQ